MWQLYKSGLCITLYFFNSILFVAGMSVLLTAVYLELEHQHHHCVSDAGDTHNTLMLPHVATFLGGYIMIVCGVGSVVLFSAKPVQLYVYSAFMVLLCMMTLGAGVSLACYRHSWSQALLDTLTHSLTFYDPEAFNHSVDLVQHTFDCCGVYNYTDWLRASPQRSIPKSCCTNLHECVVSDYNNLFHRGCYDVIVADVHRYAVELTLLAAVILVYPLIGVVFACAIAHYTKKIKGQEPVAIQ